MKTLYIILFSFFLISCEKDIEMDIPTTASVLVVNSIFCTDSNWSVQVSQSLSVKMPDSSTRFINNAKVNLLDSAGNLIEELKYQQNRYISILGNKPQVGTKYKLTVGAGGFEDISTESYIPDTNRLNDIQFRKGLSIDKRYNQLADYLLFETNLKDNPATKDFYIVEFISVDTYSFQKLEIEGDDNYFESFSSTVSQQTRVFFSDETFNGQDKIIKLKSNIGSLFISGMPAQFFPNCYLRIYSVSEQLFKYLLSYYRQVESTEYEYTNQPIRVENNIVNGLGIFGGYTYTDCVVDKYKLAELLQ